MKIFKIRQWTDVNLFMRNMEPHIFHDEGKSIMKSIVRYNLLLAMGTMKKVGPN
jgi:hypothetical protein